MHYYPMLQNVIRKVLGESVTLVNSAVEVANAVKKLLDKTDYRATMKRVK